MHKIYLLFSFLLLIVALPSQADLKLIIDPGHGGKDRGVVRGPAIEAEINLKIAQKVERKIQQYPELQIFLTRQANTDLSLNDRIQFSQALEGDFFISIHANSSPDIRAQGAEFYIRQPEISLTNLSGKRDERTATDTESVVKNILQDLRSQNHAYNSRELSLALNASWDAKNKRPQPIRQAPFFVINKSPIPAALIEIGYISNPSEARRLLKEETQEKIATQIFEGILKFKETMDRNRHALIE